MIDESLIRITLWLSVPFNVVAATALFLPASKLGRMMALPREAAALYTAMLGYFVLLFAGVYAWLASSAVINTELLGLGVIGKAGVFVIVFVLWRRGAGAWQGVLVASGDLAFALLWGAWLLR